MRFLKTLVAGFAAALLLSTGAFAGTALNEVGAFLVYPIVLAEGDDEGVDSQNTMVGLETFVTITNAGPDDVIAHISYINGEEEDYDYCYECDFEIPLTGNDTETLVVTYGPYGTHIVAEDLYLDMSCPFHKGMIVVALQDEDGNTISDNVLLGEEVVVDYDAGMAFSIPAIPFQGSSNDGNREYSFDDAEYGKLPRIVAADFLAPKIYGPQVAHLALFTLGFERQFPPLVDCSVIGFDADENPFSTSFQFGCWTVKDLCYISPEFCWPNLGVFDDKHYGHPMGPGGDTHGWLQLNCRVDRNPEAADGFEADGGVHGAIFQVQYGGTRLPAGSHAEFDSSTMWGRLLYQSVTTGDAVTLVLEAAPLGME